MGENATEGIFIGTYVFVFIVALSATITMFIQINEYSDLAYKYGKNIENAGTLIETEYTTPARLVTADQIIGYYFNYISTGSSQYDIEVYRELQDDGTPKNRIFNSTDDGKELSYKQVISELGGLKKLNQMYQLKYISYNYDTGKSVIRIIPYIEE